MSTNTLTYSYDELIQRSEEIELFANNFDKELSVLKNNVTKMSGNLSNENASIIYKLLEKINNKSEDIQKALVFFSKSIHDEIAPTYLKIENKARDTVEDYYAN